VELDLQETGVLGLRGANVFPGLLTRRGAPRAALGKGWFMTGDVDVSIDGFAYIEGRLSRFSKSARDGPHGTVEQKLVEHFDIDRRKLRGCRGGRSRRGQSESWCCSPTLI